MADAHSKNHDYHIIDPSPWPLIGSAGALIMAIGGVVWMQSLKDASATTMGMSGPWVFIVGLLVVLYTMYGWWADTIKEAHAGDHTRVVSLHLRYGMIMFIASEVMFFVAWFWAFFDAALYPDEALQTARVAHTGGQHGRDLSGTRISKWQHHDRRSRGRFDRGPSGTAGHVGRGRTSPTARTRRRGRGHAGAR